MGEADAIKNPSDINHNAFLFCIGTSFKNNDVGLFLIDRNIRLGNELLTGRG